MDKVCQKITKLESLTQFKDINFDSFNKEDKENIEKSLIDMMIQFKSTPIELGQGNLENLHNKVDGKWKWAFSTKRKMKETTLAQIMPNGRQIFCKFSID